MPDMFSIASFRQRSDSTLDEISSCFEFDVATAMLSSGMQKMNDQMALAIAQHRLGLFACASVRAQYVSII